MSAVAGWAARVVFTACCRGRGPDFEQEERIGASRDVVTTLTRSAFVGGGVKCPFRSSRICLSKTSSLCLKRAVGFLLAMEADPLTVLGILDICLT